MPSAEVTPAALFVYGTLKRGQVNDVLLLPHARLIQPAWTRGRLQDLGDFPALARGDAVVRGELVHVEEEILPRLVEVLDGLEGYREGDEPGSHYLRRVIHAWTDTGEEHRASAYFYNCANPDLPALDLFPVVETGEWPAPAYSGRGPGTEALETFRRHVALYRHNVLPPRDQQRP